MRELLAPTMTAAGIWAVAFLLLLAGWIWRTSRRMTALLRRIREDDAALWAELGSPRSWDALSKSPPHLRKLRRLKNDDRFAMQFDNRVVKRIRELQGELSTEIVVMALVACAVLYLVWPHMR